MNGVNAIIGGLALGVGYYYATSMEDVETESDVETDAFVEETGAIISTSLIAMGILYGCVEGFFAGGEYVEEELGFHSAQGIASGRICGMIGGSIAGGIIASAITEFALSKLD